MSKWRISVTAFGIDTLKTMRTFEIDGSKYSYYSLKAAGETKLGDLSRLPFSIKVLLENLLRFEDGVSVTVHHLEALTEILKGNQTDQEIAYRPARVLMQDFTGVPAIVDLAAMRDAMSELGGNPDKINPLSRADLVIDHSVQVDKSGSLAAFQENVDIEMSRNRERYEFLRWGQTAFDNFNVIPPGTGICHQVNLEHLAKTVWTSKVGDSTFAFPDTLVGTDSHTTMVNALAVLGWGVGGIEAEAAMLGQPISMLIPEVIGVRLNGALLEGRTATDLVLTITEMLRKKGVVGKFIEYTGPGLGELALADKATISNMAPEYGATCGFFPVDQETLNYLRLSGRDEKHVKLVEHYSKIQGLWRDDSTPEPTFTDLCELDMRSVEPSLAGPKRPQDRISLSGAKLAFEKLLEQAPPTKSTKESIADGNIVIAAITSCTNTSNPSVMVAAGLLARKARRLGLRVKPWVKTSLAPGSKVVTDYLSKASLDKDLDSLGFHLVGYGCTTCIGNSGPLDPQIETLLREKKPVVASVLSGNRNFEGRIHGLTQANYLASPPLVVAYALAGSMLVDLSSEPLGVGSDGTPVYLKDIWPSTKEIQNIIGNSLSPTMFRHRYAAAAKGDDEWRNINIPEGQTYSWPESTYVRKPPYFLDIQNTPKAVRNVLSARILALLGDSVTTDHISPAGEIPVDGPAGKYLSTLGVEPYSFNSFGARRGNHEIMVRGTFANIRLRNEMAPGTEGGWTTLMPEKTLTTIFDAAMHYAKENTSLIVIAGKEYGTGSSRDWAAKGTKLLGVKAVIAESYERIHRSNLVGMGVLPLSFQDGIDRNSLELDGSELIDIIGVDKLITPKMQVPCVITRESGEREEISLLCQIDTANEVDYYLHGGILPYVLRQLAVT
jgi:aconitate hydratase